MIPRIDPEGLDQGRLIRHGDTGSIQQHHPMATPVGKGFPPRLGRLTNAGKELLPHGQGQPLAGFRDRPARGGIAPPSRDAG
jgi:hypothetical protein